MEQKEEEDQNIDLIKSEIEALQITLNAFELKVHEGDN